MFFQSTRLGVFALMLNFLLQLTNSINETLDTVSNHENRLINLERCSYFTEVEPEEGYKGLASLENALRKGQNIQIDTDKLSWPKTGDLLIQNLSIRYRDDLPLVIKNISLNVKQGTKIGIVGRTGAGKTTLISALYRTFDDYGGKIFISGKEIRSVDLKVLRNTMTIIPQDPYLFEDTLQNNLDPTNKFSEDKIQEILEEVGIWDKFAKLQGTKTAIERGGANLS